MQKFNILKCSGCGGKHDGIEVYPGCDLGKFTTYCPKLGNFVEVELIGLPIPDESGKPFAGKLKSGGHAIIYLEEGQTEILVQYFETPDPEFRGQGWTKEDDDAIEAGLVRVKILQRLITFHQSSFNLPFHHPKGYSIGGFKWVHPDKLTGFDIAARIVEDPRTLLTDVSVALYNAGVALRQYINYEFSYSNGNPDFERVHNLIEQADLLMAQSMFGQARSLGR